jgi:hypothetical protein
MLERIRARWPLISTCLLAMTLLGAGGVRLYEAKHGDCCHPGSPCCYPGSPCCHGHAAPPAPGGRG